MSQGSEDICDALGENRACEIVCACAFAFPTDAGVAKYSCRAIVNLANGCDERKTKLTRAGACLVVANAAQVTTLT